MVLSTAIDGSWELINRKYIGCCYSCFCRPDEPSGRGSCVGCSILTMPDACKVVNLLFNLEITRDRCDLPKAGLKSNQEFSASMRSGHSAPILKLIKRPFRFSAQRPSHAHPVSI